MKKVTSLLVTHVEFQGDQGLRREFTEFCMHWTRLVGVTLRHILEKVK